MFTYYRNLSTKTKLITGVSLIALVLAYTLSFATESVIPAVTFTVIGLAVLHVLVSYPRFITTTLLLLGQAVTITYVAIVYAGTNTALFGTDLTLAVVTSTSILLVVSLVILYVAIYHARGNRSLNLLIAFALLDFAGLILGYLLGFNYLIALTFSAILGLGFIIVRCFQIFKTNSTGSEQIQAELTSEKNNNKIEKLLTAHNDWHGFRVPDNENYWVINTGKKILVVSTVEFKENLRKTKNGYMYKTVPVENLYFEILSTMSEISNEYKIPRNKTYPVIVTTNNKYPLPAVGYQQYEIKSVGNRAEKNKFIVTTLQQLPTMVSKIKDTVSDKTWEKVVKN